MSTISPVVVLFDMDGVLVDVSGSYRRAAQETASHYLSRPIGPEVVQDYKNRGGFNNDWRLTEAIIRGGGADVPFPDIVTTFDRLYRGPEWDGYIASEPALVSAEILESMGHRTLGVVTGRPRIEARWTLQRFGWEKYFRVLVAMEDQGGRGKPDPWPMLVALDRLAAEGTSAAPEEAVYVGDSVDDMQSARAAGLRAIGFVPPYLAGSDLAIRLERAGAEAVIDRHEHLEEALKSLHARGA